MRATAHGWPADRLLPSHPTSGCAANNTKTTKRQMTPEEETVTIRALEDYDDHVPTVAAAEQTASSRRRILIAGTIGTAIEWYDFFIYGLIAPLVFDQLFFPNSTSSRRPLRCSRRLPSDFWRVRSAGLCSAISVTASAGSRSCCVRCS